LFTWHKTTTCITDIIIIIISPQRHISNLSCDDGHLEFIAQVLKMIQQTYMCNIILNVLSKKGNSYTNFAMPTFTKSSYVIEI